MGREINIDRICDLEKQIEEGAEDIIKLKRARNSLLNISTVVPPEILGSIFHWNVIPDEGLPPFDALPEGTYSFLLVCHHWFEVASHTPELWSSWGNTLEKWSQRYKRSGTTPVDLVLNKHGNMGGSQASLDEPLRDALRDRAACNVIRSLHLRTKERSLSTYILSILTPDDEDVRCSSIESITLEDVDPSKFFARYRFPKLWYLDLSTGVTISSWEDFGLRTTALTTLSLNMSHVPTTQLLSILSSNPRLQSLDLSENMIPHDNGDEPIISVPLRHLKKLSVEGTFHLVFQLLYRLDYPETMDAMVLNIVRCTVEDFLGTLGPYMEDYIRRDGRFLDGPGVDIVSFMNAFSVQVNTINSVTGSIQEVPFARFSMIYEGDLSVSARDKLYIDFLAHTPREHVVYFNADMRMDAVRGTVAAMPKLQELHLTRPWPMDRFLQPDLDGPLANKKLLPSLRHLHLEHLEENDWSFIIPYLTHQTSDGQRISLTILFSGRPQHICEDVLKEMKELVEELVLNLTLDDACPLGCCSVSEEEDVENRRSRRAFQRIDHNLGCPM